MHLIFILGILAPVTFATESSSDTSQSTRPTQRVRPFGSVAMPTAINLDSPLVEEPKQTNDAALMFLGEKIAAQTETMQVFIVHSMGGAEKYEEVVNALNNKSPETSDRTSTEKEDEKILDCDLLSDIGEHRYNAYTSVTTKLTSDCLENALVSASKTCSIFFNTKAEKGSRLDAKYAVSLSLFACYFPDEICSNGLIANESRSIIDCLSKVQLPFRLAFDEFLDDVKPLCCHFVNLNTSQVPTTTIISNYWMDLSSSISSSLRFILDLPNEYCQKHVLVEFLFSQTSLSCYNKKRFVYQETAACFIIFFIGVGSGLVSRMISVRNIAKGYTPPKTGETPFFLYVFPVILMITMEVMLNKVSKPLKICENLFHFIIILFRYETANQLIFKCSLIGMLVVNFPDVCSFLWEGFKEWWSLRLTRECPQAQHVVVEWENQDPPIIEATSKENKVVQGIASTPKTPRKRN